MFLFEFDVILKLNIYICRHNDLIKEGQQV